MIGGDQMVAPVTRLENTVHYERTIYLAHHQNHYEPLVPKLGFDWSFERTNLHPVINTVEDQTSCGAITLGQKPINLVEKLNLNRNLADDFNILQEKIVKDSQGFIKVVSSKRKKKSNQTSVQNSASIPGSQFKTDQPTHCNPATERNKKVNSKPSKPSQVNKQEKSSLVSKPSETKPANKQSKPEQMSKPAEKSSEQTSKRKTKHVIKKDDIAKTENQKDEEHISSMVFSNSNLNVDSERELKNKNVEVIDTSDSSQLTNNHSDCTPLGESERDLPNNLTPTQKKDVSPPGQATTTTTTAATAATATTTNTTTAATAATATTTTTEHKRDPMLNKKQFELPHPLLSPKMQNLSWEETLS